MRKYNYIVVLLAALAAILLPAEAWAQAAAEQVGRNLLAYMANTLRPCEAWMWGLMVPAFVFGLWNPKTRAMMAVVGPLGFAWFVWKYQTDWWMYAVAYFIAQYFLPFVGKALDLAKGVTGIQGIWNLVSGFFGGALVFGVLGSASVWKYSYQSWPLGKAPLVGFFLAGVWTAWSSYHGKKKPKAAEAAKPGRRGRDEDKDEEETPRRKPKRPRPPRTARCVAGHVIPKGCVVCPHCGQGIRGAPAPQPVAPHPATQAAPATPATTTPAQPPTARGTTRRPPPRSLGRR